MFSVKPVIPAQVDIAFEPADLSGSRYEGWIADRMSINIEKRLLQLDLEMLLEPFVNRPGKQWWAGEHVGKYLHAATYAWEFTGDDRLKARLDDTVEKLIQTQLPNGYLGTYQEKDQFAWGDGLGWDGPVWDVWTHKYVLIGLLTYFRATDHAPALEASRRAADLMYELFVVQKRSFRLASAHMGMAATSVLEPIALLYRLTGEPRYLEFCHVIIDAWDDKSNPETWMYEDGCQLLASLLEHGSVYETANRKAYEMLSNLVGLLELYRVDPDERYLTACGNAWNDIATKRLYMTGTASYFEQFTQDDRLPPVRAVGEGCVTVTWLQLTRQLLELTGKVRYADELERTTYNALLAAQSPQTGEVTYFVPLLGRKHYNGHDVKLTPAISCCSSSIPRGIALIPTFASGVLNGAPALLQYIPGKHVLHYKNGENRKRVTLHVRGDYPKTGDVEIEVELEQTARFAVVLRAPSWAAGFKATVDGVTYTPEDSRLIAIERTWSPGDKIGVQIPLKIRVVSHNDKTLSSVAFARGPQVLASDSAVADDGAIPESGWWGEDLYSHVARQNGTETEFKLVTFADAGQNKEEYAVLHEGIEVTD
ncbi:MAG: beta-L-arabinofuranosidase domain-containing protein [Woeseiaceae bacterium]